jgi:hypothetical protein
MNCCPTMSTDVNSRYRIDATISSGTGVKVTAEVPRETPRHVTN